MDLNLEATELRLALPGTAAGDDDGNSSVSSVVRTANKRNLQNDSAPPPKAQVVGWPPIKSFRKNTLQPKKAEPASAADGGGIYVKVSMDGAPYLRKIDLGIYKAYPELLNALEGMFKFTIGKYCEREGYKGSEFAPTYEDKDGDWMLVGDVPWQMFICSCKRMRIMKGSEIGGLNCGI